MIYNINNEIIFPSMEKPELTEGGSYYKFYQIKLRQLLTQTRYRKEQEARLARMRTPLYKDQLIQQQRFHHEYLNYLRERSKPSSQDSFIDQNSTHEQSIISNRTIPSTIISTTTTSSASIESRAKTLVPPKPRCP